MVLFATYNLYVSAELSGLFDATGFQTIRANTNLLASAVDERTDPLQIGVPAPPPRIVCVANHISVLRTFATNITSLGHEELLLWIGGGILAEISGPNKNRLWQY
jgi:hypothetical protein